MKGGPRKGKGLTFPFTRKRTWTHTSNALFINFAEVTILPSDRKHYAYAPHTHLNLTTSFSTQPPHIQCIPLSLFPHLIPKIFAKLPTPLVRVPFGLVNFHFFFWFSLKIFNFLVKPKIQKLSTDLIPFLSWYGKFS